MLINEKSQKYSLFSILELDLYWIFFQSASFKNLKRHQGFMECKKSSVRPSSDSGCFMGMNIGATPSESDSGASVSVWESRGSFANIYSFNEVFSETFSSSGLEWSHFWAPDTDTACSITAQSSVTLSVKLSDWKREITLCSYYPFYENHREHHYDEFCELFSHLSGKNMKIKDQALIVFLLWSWYGHVIFYADGCCSMSSSFEPGGKKCWSCNSMRII